MPKKRVALVIGNSAYQAVPALPNPANDARMMSDTLLSPGFFVVGGQSESAGDRAVNAGVGRRATGNRAAVPFPADFTGNAYRELNLSEI
jgi:hypothetical protein